MVLTTVYVVGDHYQYDSGQFILGIFTTEEAAIQCRDEERDSLRTANPSLWGTISLQVRIDAIMVMAVNLNEVL